MSPPEADALGSQRVERVRKKGSRRQADQSPSPEPFKAQGSVSRKPRTRHFNLRDPQPSKDKLEVAVVALISASLVVYAAMFPKSWLGDALSSLVTNLLRRLAATRPLTILCFVAAVAALVSLVAYGRFEGLIMAGLAAPETFAVFFAVDVGTALEVLLIGWLAARHANVRALSALVDQARDRLRSYAGRTRKKRRGQLARRPASANDDEPAQRSIRWAKAA